MKIKARKAFTPQKICNDFVNNCEINGYAGAAMLVDQATRDYIIQYAGVPFAMKLMLPALIRQISKKSGESATKIAATVALGMGLEENNEIANFETEGAIRRGAETVIRELNKLVEMHEQANSILRSVAV